jgi:aspartate-semialdehyde dehydrogenase
MSRERPRCAAIVGAGSLDGKALFDRLKALGLKKEEILCFGPKLGSWEVALSEGNEEAEVYLPLEEGLLAPAGFIFLLSGDTEARGAVQRWAGRRGWLLDLAAPPGEAAGWADPFLPKKRAPGNGFRASVPAPEAYYLAQVLRALPAAGLEKADCHVFLPASTLGEPGIQELYQQSVGVLSFKTIPTEVFGRQVAFNLVPVPDQDAAIEFARQVAALSGREVEVSSIVLRAPVFHSVALSAVFTVGRAASALEALRRYVDSQDVFRLAGEEAWPTPLEVAGEERPILGLRMLSPRHLWAWLLFDNVKAGKALFAARLYQSAAETR